MISVSQLLTLPKMDQLKLCNNPSTLQNIVKGTGIFEWESIEDIRKTFNEGEFVVTSLSNVKDNYELLYASLRTLLEVKVSAIAIKTVWCTSLPKKITELADLHNIPIFFFNDTYMDDMIYEVKHALINQGSNWFNLKTLRNIVGSNDPEEIKTLSYSINPLFFDNYQCICISPKNEEQFETQLSDKLSHCINQNKANTLTQNFAYSFIKCNKCFLLIFSFEKDAYPNEAITTLLGSLSISTTDFYINLSQPKNNLSQMKASIHEVLFTQAVAQVDRLYFLSFNDLGADTLIFSEFCYSKTRNYYNHINGLLEKYDHEHNSRLKETIIAYTKCNNDINLTSDTLFQHSNTIRYRLSKAKSILSLEDKSDGDIQLYLYARMDQIISVLDKPWI